MNARRVTAVIFVALMLTMAASAYAIVVTRVTVTTAATLLYTAATGGSTVLIRNPGSVSVYLGTVTVTTATGFELAAGDAVTVPLGPLDPVYGIVAASTNDVHVMESRR